MPNEPKVPRNQETRVGDTPHQSRPISGRGRGLRKHEPVVRVRARAASVCFCGLGGARDLGRQGPRMHISPSAVRPRAGTILAGLTGKEHADILEEVAA